VLLVAAGCRRQVVTGSGAAVGGAGAETPRLAVERFMSAVKSQDMQGFGLVWGSRDGAAIATMDQESREKRQLILMCYLKHDSYTILGEAPSPGGERVLALEIKLRDMTRPTNFFLARGPRDRWFVREPQIEPLRDFCADRSPSR
jgi:hypothetical protein